MILFPELQSGSWARVDLNKESQNVDVDFTDPEACRRWVDSIHAARGIQYSYGGFLEDRSRIWAEHYLKDKGAFVHVGVDYNVPEGTSVAFPHRSEVIETILDKSFGGWGGAVLCRLSNHKIYFVYAHLDEDISVQAGRTYERGNIMGAVGSSKTNGHWFPHLHVQIMDSKFFNAFGGNLTGLDGYLPKGHPMLKHAVNPRDWLSF